MIKFLKNHWIYLVLLFVIAFGVFFRFWHLSEIPPGIYPDEAKNANDAIETLLTGEYKLFYPENNGREGLYIWIIAWSYKLFGISVYALKFPGALMGTLTIIGTYLATKEMLRYATNDNGHNLKIKLSQIGIETAALLSSGFLALSFWHVNFSRIGFRAIMVPLLLSFGLYWTFKTLRTKKFWPSVFAGITWGLGFYTYTAFRAALIIPFGIVTIAFIGYILETKPKINLSFFEKSYIKDGWWKVDNMFIVMIATMAPMLSYFYKNPEHFMSRATGISVFDKAEPMIAFLKNLGAHVQMLFFVGDSNWRHNFSEDPGLMLPVAIMFLFGVLYSFIAIGGGFKRKNWNSIVVHLTLFGGLNLMVLPAALATEGIPHALRAIGLMPFVFIYAGLGFLYIVRLIFPHKHHREEVWPFIFGTALIILLLISSFQFTHYFAEWGRKDEVKDAFAKNSVEIGKYFNTEDSAQKYLIINDNGIPVTYPEAVVLCDNCTDNTLPYEDAPAPGDKNKLPISANTTLFIQRTHNTDIKNTTYIYPEQLPLSVDNAVFAPLSATEEVKNQLRNFYPQGVELDLEYIWIYRVE
ncbi:MAG: hypothetical protein R3346_00030 [Candidatus Spechtbacterales bacterium]|nr:hypothetical protein [Candidatus Spechtbacterales bacterium]